MQLPVCSSSTQSSVSCPSSAGLRFSCLLCDCMHYCQGCGLRAAATYVCTRASRPRFSCAHSSNALVLLPRGLGNANRSRRHPCQTRDDDPRRVVVESSPDRVEVLNRLLRMNSRSALARLNSCGGVGAHLRFQHVRAPHLDAAPSSRASEARVGRSREHRS